MPVQHSINDVTLLPDNRKHRRRRSRCPERYPPIRQAQDFCVLKDTARCLFSRSKRFEQPEKSCRPCGQSHLQSREIKFCLSVGFLAEQTRNLMAGIEIQYSVRYIPKNAGGVLSQKISLRRSSEIRHLNNLRYI